MEAEKMKIKEHFKSYIPLLEQITRKKGYYKILEDIFESNCSIDEENMYMNLMNIVTQIFKVNGAMFLELLVNEQEYDFESIDAKFKNLSETIKLLKYKYGYRLLKANNRNRNPYGLQSFLSSTGKNISNTNIKLIRNDDQALILNCQADELLTLSNSINNALMQSVTNGIFNLEKENIKEFVKINRELVTKLMGILNEFEKEDKL